VHRYRNDNQPKYVTTAKPHIETSTHQEIPKQNDNQYEKYENSSVTIEKIERDDGNLL
jgi:hypothetical protein